MAKGAAAAGDTSKMFSADVVAAVLMASGTVSLSMTQYEIMSALDGTRTASSFQHSFRAVLAKAKELKARVDGGEVFVPVAPASKRGGNPTPATPKTNSTPKKRKNDSSDDGHDDETPSKKKATPKSRSKKAPVVDEEPPTNDYGVDFDLPTDDAMMQQMIKDETAWENEQF